MNSKGFTLLEVILVCLVLGIVSVVVMPRILNLQNDARIAIVEKTFSSFQEAIRFSHAKWQVNGEGNTAISNMYGYGPTDDSGNYMLDMNDVGYPVGINKREPMTTPHNIGEGDKGCYELFSAVVSTGFIFSTSDGDSSSADFITKRKNYTFLDAAGISQTKLAICYYIYTKQGFHSDPSLAEVVYWYNSRDGSVAKTEPN